MDMTGNLFVFNFNWSLITLQYCGGFCLTFTWISLGCTCVPHPDPSSHFPPHPISWGHPSAPGLSTQPHALNLDWQSVSQMVIYLFQYHSLKSSYPRLLPQSTAVSSLHLCLFCCLTYRVIVTIFLNSIFEGSIHRQYMETSRTVGVCREHSRQLALIYQQ